MYSSRAVMDKHLKFQQNKQRIFIEDILNKSNQKISFISKMIGVSPRTFSDWKNEKYSIAEKPATYLSTIYGVSFPENIQLMRARWQSAKSANSRIGGYARQKLYGNPATPEGRSKGGKNALQKMREKGLIPKVNEFDYPKLSKNLAEFVGIVLGDGSITKFQTTITLNRKADAEYVNYVTGLCDKLFATRPKIHLRNDSLALVIYYNGVNLVKFLQKIGLKIGNKVKNQVCVPEWIINKQKYCNECCRGLIDTDGCITIHKYKLGQQKYVYPKLIFTNCSKPLADFIFNVLKSHNLHPKRTNVLGKNRIWLYNSQEVQRYLCIIGSNNQRILRFKESGPDGKATSC